MFTDGKGKLTQDDCTSQPLGKFLLLQMVRVSSATTSFHFIFPASMTLFSREILERRLGHLESFTGLCQTVCADDKLAEEALSLWTTGASGQMCEKWCDTELENLTTHPTLILFLQC